MLQFPMSVHAVQIRFTHAHLRGELRTSFKNNKLKTLWIASQVCLYLPGSAMNFLYVCLWARNKRTEISPIILGSSETVSFRYCSHPFSRLLLLLYDTLFFWGGGQFWDTGEQRKGKQLRSLSTPSVNVRRPFSSPPARTRGLLHECLWLDIMPTSRFGPAQSPGCIPVGGKWHTHPCFDNTLNSCLIPQSTQYYLLLRALK